MKKKKEKKIKKDRYASEQKAKSGLNSVPLETDEPEIMIKEGMRPNSRNKAAKPQYLRTQDFQKHNTATKGLKPNNTKISRMLTGKQNQSKVMVDNTGLDLEPPELTVLDTSGVGLNKDLDYLAKIEFMPDHGSNLKHKNKSDSKTELRKRLFGKAKNKVSAGPYDQREYIKPGSQINDQTLYTGNISIYDQPDTILDQDDYDKRLRFDKLKRARLEAMCQWKQSDQKGFKKGAYIKDIQSQNDQILQVIEKDDIEKIEVYTDRFPILKLRKQILRFAFFISDICYKIITQTWFDNISIMVIMINCFVMIMDPGDECINLNDSFFCAAEGVFTYLYIIEMVLKIAGMGFILRKGSYLRDGWNILDFTIVMSSIAEIILASVQKNNQAHDHSDHLSTLPPGIDGEKDQGANLKALRVVRVARPLKTISSIKGLKVIIVAVLSALPLLKDTMMVLGFFFVVFGILGQQLFGGILKNRCLNIQTGNVHPQELYCSQMFLKKGQSSCPEGYICSKTDENPNYGVTNFDNLTYSMLAIFQCITLEGWSEIQRDIQNTFHKEMYLFFIPMVVFGAFFLLNLTLAVINSKFTEAHNLQQEKDKIELSAANAAKLAILLNDDEGANAALLHDEISLSQFINARIYAKKMIEFLRMRQEIKRIEAERVLNTKIKVQQQNKLRRSSMIIPPGSRSLSKSKSAMLKYELDNLDESSNQDKDEKDGNQLPQLTKSQSSEIFKNLDRRALEDQSAVIKEEDDDEDQSQDEKDKLEKEVRNFLFRSKIEMQKSESKLKAIQQNSQPYEDQKSVIKRNQQNASPFTLDSEDSGPKLMGNLSITKLNINKETFQKLADDLDIDKIIKKEDQVVQASAESIGLEKESIKSFEVGSMKSQVSFFQNDDNQEPQVVDLINIPGIDLHNLKKEPESGLISSDSDFDMQEAQLEANKNNLSASRLRSNEKKSNDISQDVSKTFKRMLTSNHNRDYNQDPLKLTQAEIELIQSTRYGQSSDPRLLNVNQDYLTQISVGESNSKQTQQNYNEIEKKYAKRRQVVLHKQYKEEEYLQHLTTVQNQFKNNGQDYKFQFKTPGKELRTLEEFVNSKQPRNVFQDIDPLFKKVEINHGTIYNSSSQIDVFHPRQVQKEKYQMMQDNKFLQLAKTQNVKELDPDYQSKTYIRNVHEPFQIKKFYEVQEDSSDLLTESSENEDDLAAEEQPFMTANRIGCKQQTKQLFTKEVCKRSDIMITSTISMSLFPKDQRVIEQHMRVYMDQIQLIEFVDEKNAFKAMVKEHDYQVKKEREKDKEYRDNYAKSVIFTMDFVSPSLQKFKSNVTELNRNKKQKIKKHNQELHRERIRHKQLLQASRKRGSPSFDMSNINNLLDGTYHEEEEEDLVSGGIVHNINRAMRVKKEDYDKDKRMSEFQEEIQEIMRCDNHECNRDHALDMVDEVPFTLRKEFNIPRNLANNQINFNQIRKYDAQKKKTRQIWSGQDVLPDSIDVQKSFTIIQQINNHRIWPLDMFGLYKRFKYIIRIHAKSEAYDNFFTLIVLLSTVAMCAEKYGDKKEKVEYLKTFDLIVTYIFIYEMVMKQFAIGINKYLADTMNWLDGFIVLTSVIELIPKWIEKIQKNIEESDNNAGQVINDDRDTVEINVGALRVLRTLRVLRMVRLLRALKSMQVILGVVVSSYKSFMYITILMVLFIFILSLLGLQLFKGKYDDDPLGIPDNNFERFGPSFFTMFQILTMENWQTILFVTLRNQKDVLIDIYLPTTLFIAWIFVGNFILLNLFLAILLDAFLEEDDEQLDEIQIAVIKEKKRAKKLERKRRKQANMILMDVNSYVQKKKAEGSLVNLGEEKNNSMEELEDLDSDQIKNIFQDEGIIQKDKKDMQEEEKLFDGVECQSSFYMFSKDNIFRITCYRATKHRFWETIVFTLIFLSSFKLVTDSYSLKWDNDQVNKISNILDYAFNFAFLIEMLIKLVSIGLIMDTGSYLRDEWNTLDFFIVCSSLVDMSLTNFDVKFVKVMRTLRALRPLRFITHNVAMRLLVNALIKSLGGIFNVLFVVFVVYLLFAILAGSFYRGKFFYCSIDPFILQFQPQCEVAGGEWLLYDHNFDNAGRGSITMFIVASLEGWPDIFVQAWQAYHKQKETDEFAHGPVEDDRSSFALALCFFFVFIFIGSFFFLNFFTGVLFMKFNQAQEAENKGFTKQDLAWKDIQKMILKSSPDYETTNVPPQKWRRKLHQLVIDDRFETLIMTCIILNMVQMMLYIDDIKNQNYYEEVLAGFNLFFSAVFLIEAILKLVAFGMSYFQSNWNIFDFTVVLSSIIDIFSSSEALSELDSEFISQLSKNAKLLRIARVARILRLAGKAKGLQAILQTIFFSLPALGNVAVLLSLIYFMLAIVANFLFNDIIEGEVLDSQRKNFSNFMNSLVLLFALSTGEDWNKVMFDCSRSPEDGCVVGVNCAQYPNFSFVFFIFMIIVCSYVMLNLFVLVIIQQFEKYYLSEDENILSKFQNDLASFKQVWKELTLERYACQKIKEKQLMAFFRDLGELNASLGFPAESFTDDEMKKALLRMGIKGDNGYIYFNELLYRCMRRKYGTMKINKQMQIYELKTQYSIYLIGLNAQRGIKSKKPDHDDLINNLVKKDTGVNPFLTIMNFRISFKTWLKFARQELNLIERKNSGEENISNKQEKQYEVEIDKEEEFELTSEEEVVDPQINFKDGKSIEVGSMSGSDSYYKGIQRQKTVIQKSPTSQKNHMDILKKKMAQKIKSRQEQIIQEQKFSQNDQYQSTKLPSSNILMSTSVNRKQSKMSQIQDGRSRRKSKLYGDNPNPSISKSQFVQNTKKQIFSSLSNFSSKQSGSKNDKSI